MSFWTWGNSVWNSSEVMRLTSRGRLGIGTTDPQELLHVVGKAIIHSGIGTSPTNGVYGSGGTRIILWPGAVDNTPYSLGIAGATLWYTVPTGASHIFYHGTTDPQELLHVVGKAIIHNGVGLAPTNGVYGSGGTRIIGLVLLIIHLILLV